MTPEGRFKRRIKKRIREYLPGCFMHEMKAGKQGIPDTLIIFRKRWALLEFKESENAHHRPNQDYYVALFNDLGFSRFVYPENEIEVMNDLIKYMKEE